MAWKFTHAMVLGAVLVTSNARAADGDLDLSFGVGGLARVGVEDIELGVRGIALQVDGKVVICDTDGFSGPSSSDFLVARFNADGTPDSSFGSNGRTAIDFGAKDYCSGLALQADGRIVLSGTTFNSALPVGGDAMFAIARLNADGTPDPAFGDGTGRTTIQFPAGTSSAAAVVIQRDGKIVVAGRAKVDEPDYAMDFAVVRLLSNGSPDLQFGNAGRITAGPSDITSFDYANSVALDRQGRIVMAGVIGNETGVVRLLGSGGIDPSFGNEGWADVPFAYPGKLIVQRDGKLVVGGSADNAAAGMAVLRLSDDGSIDTGFGTQGVSVIPFDLGTPGARDVIAQSDDKLVVAGALYFTDSNHSQAVVARLDSHGHLDSTFGDAGKAVFDFGLTSTDAQGFTALASAGGRIIVAGTINVSDVSESASDDFVVRLQNDLVFSDGVD